MFSFLLMSLLQESEDNECCVFSQKSSLLLHTLPNSPVYYQPTQFKLVHTYHVTESRLFVPP